MILDELDLLFDNQRWARDLARFNLRESRINFVIVGGWVLGFKLLFSFVTGRVYGTVGNRSLSARVENRFRDSTLPNFDCSGTRLFPFSRLCFGFV